MLVERAKVVCRECLGFGHARTTCPTRRKLSELTGLSPYIKSCVGQYRSHVTKIESSSLYVWPGLEFLEKWTVATEVKLGDKKEQHKEVKLILETNFLSLSKLVCKLCNGFGHIPDDYQNNK
jgi:hypothetical protein